MLILLIFIALGGIIWAVFDGKKSLKNNIKELGLTGPVKYNDLDGRGRVFKNQALRIKAKPDVMTDKIIEYKSGKSPKEGPFFSDMLQVGATMMTTGVNESEIRYPERNFVIKNSEWLKKEVLGVLDQMRYSLENKKAPRPTPSTKKCQACDFRLECPKV